MKGFYIVLHFWIFTSTHTVLSVDGIWWLVRHWLHQWKAVLMKMVVRIKYNLWRRKEQEEISMSWIWLLVIEREMAAKDGILQWIEFECIPLMNQGASNERGSGSCPALEKMIRNGTFILFHLWHNCHESGLWNWYAFVQTYSMCDVQEARKPLKSCWKWWLIHVILAEAGGLLQVQGQRAT